MSTTKMAQRNIFLSSLYTGAENWPKTSPVVYYCEHKRGRPGNEASFSVQYHLSSGRSHGKALYKISGKDTCI